jgi:hypothetical protein
VDEALSLEETINAMRRAAKQRVDGEIWRDGGKTICVQPGRSHTKKNITFVVFSHTDNLNDMLNEVTPSTNLNKESKSATPSEQYVEWGNNINFSS